MKSSLWRFTASASPCYTVISEPTGLGYSTEQRRCAFLRAVKLEDDAKMRESSRCLTIPDQCCYEAGQCPFETLTYSNPGVFQMRGSKKGRSVRFGLSIMLSRDDTTLAPERLPSYQRQIHFRREGHLGIQLSTLECLQSNCE